MENQLFLYSTEFEINMVISWETHVILKPDAIEF